MAPAFAILLVLALIVFALLVWLLWRARHPKAASAKTASAAGAPAARWRWVDIREAVRRAYQTLDRGVRYILARNDWRYRSSWLLLMGFPGDGKSSIAASIPEELMRMLQRRDAKQEAYLRAAGSDADWFFLEKGILIDPKASIGEPMGKVDPRWPALLGDIDSLRPDRALDGIVWVVSAARLLAANDAELAALGRHAFTRLHELQDAFAFALPVYVVISQCDAVQGFNAFWNAQDQGLCTQLAGWSSPSIDDNGLPAEWVDKAFGKLTEGLRGLVLEAATTKDEIKQVDDFFLFPQYMRVLQVPVRNFLSIVFKPNVYETRAFCRGVYFTGVIGANGNPSSGKAPRKDVAFVAGLLRDKVFAEQRLAQRTQKGLLARNRLIRRLQVGLVAGAVALAIALPWSATQVDKRAHTLRDTVVDIGVSSRTLSQHSCLDQGRVYRLIAQVAGLDQQTRYLAIPLSWVDWRIRHGITDVVSKTALEKVVFPSIACKLQQRIAALGMATLNVSAQASPGVTYTDDQAQLKQQLADLDALEKNLGRFAAIAQPGLQTERRKLLQEFAALSEYVYGAKLPPEALKEDSALSDALIPATFDDVPYISDALHERLAQQFDRMAKQARDDLLRNAGSGATLLVTLQEGKSPLLPPLRSFNDWVGWVRSEWMLSTADDNLCTQMSSEIKPGIESLIRVHHYSPHLEDTLQYFSTAQCYQPAEDSLRASVLTPYLTNAQGPKPPGGGSPPNGEATGLKALAMLGFMQIESPRTYSCNGAAGGWRASTFDSVLADLRQYQVFAAQQNVAAASLPDEPLYDKLARMQLGYALQDALARNQRLRLSEALDAGLDATSQLDRQLSSESANAAAAMGPLVQSLRQFRQLGFDELANEVGQCAQNYASSALLNVSDLAASSHLYDPPVQQGMADNTGTIFDLGTTPVLQAYLDRQLMRVQVLSGYAAPFVTLLKQADGVNNSHRLNTQTDDYWGKTIDELNRAVQFADPAGQVAQLNDFFLKQLAGMSYANCVSVLNSYAPPNPGNDLFSDRRESVLQMARAACAGSGEADSNLHYIRIGMLFNSQLAGHYPFGPTDSSDVSPAVVKAFFVYYDKEKPELETWLKTATDSKAAKMKAFIGQLDAVETFFAGNLLATPQSAPFTADIGFRALPANSPLSNQLIAWTMHAGDNAVSWPGHATPLSWAIGQPVSLDLQWADLSRYTPLPDASQPDLTVDGYQAEYQAGGAWALLRMLDKHKSGSTSTDALNPNQQLLQFQLPVLAGPAASNGQRATQKAQLYLTVTLSSVDPSSKAVVPLTVPAFPRAAPVLW